MIRYSVIIPHYNSFELLKHLLTTIPERDDIEIIIIDDKSEFNSYQKFERIYSKKNIKILRNLSKNKGAGACRNIGLKNARGKWIIFSDADDYFLEDAFKIFDTYNNTNLDIIYFNVTSIYLGTKEKSERHIEYSKLIEDYLKNPKDEKKIRYKYIVPWGKMFKREFISSRKIFFEEIKYSNDLMFSIKSGYYADKIFAEEKNVYCVTKSKGSLTTVLTMESFETRLLAVVRLNKFLKEKGEIKYCPNFLPFLLRSKDYGARKFIYVLSLIMREEGNLIPKNLLSKILSAYYLKKVYFKIKNRDLLIKSEKTTF